MTHEMCAQDINEILIGIYVGKLARHRFEALVPKWHRMDDAIGFRRRRNMLLACTRKLKSVAHYTIATLTSKHGFLNGCFLICTWIKTPSYLGVFAFVIFPHDAKINFSRMEVSKRRLDALQQSYRPEIHVLAKGAPDGE